MRKIVREVTKKETGTYSYKDDFDVRERYIDPNDVASIAESTDFNNAAKEGRVKGCAGGTCFSQLTLYSGGRITVVGDKHDVNAMLENSGATEKGPKKRVLHG